MTQPADTSEDTIATDADAGDGTPALSPDARGVSRRVGPARWAVVALIVALLAAAAFLGFRWWQAEEGAALRAEAVTKAREYAVMLGTYDYRTFDESLAAVTANSTAEFAAKYEGVAGDLRGLV